MNYLKSTCKDARINSRKNALTAITGWLYIIDLKDVIDSDPILEFFEVEDNIPVYWPVKVLQTPRELFQDPQRIRRVELCGLRLQAHISTYKFGRLLTIIEQDTIKIIESVAEFTSIDGIVDSISMILEKDYRMFFMKRKQGLGGNQKKIG